MTSGKNKKQKSDRTGGNANRNGPTDSERRRPDSPTALTAPEKAPQSVTYMWINLLAFLVTVAVWFFLRDDVDIARRHLAILCVATYAGLVVAMEVTIYKVHRRESTGQDYDKPFTPNIQRIAIKTLGFYATMACLALAFFVLEVYRRSFFADIWFTAEEAFGIWYLFVAAQIAYFYFCDGYQKEPNDSYWMLGNFCLGNWQTVDRQVVGQHFLGWLVKGFFLPIMFVYLIGNFHSLNFDWVVQNNFIAFYDFAYTTMFTVDLLITCAGYCMTFKVLDSHIRTTEPTMLGWSAALVGYYPFWDNFYNAYLPYNDGMYWGHMTSDSVIWGCLVMALIVIYIWATLAFGVRFSNLTHRGVLTNGPYRFCKHPAYVSKNLSWWLISVPFWFHESSTISDAIRHSIMLLGVNTIYFIRARTEERHLSWDPDYVAYALWMNEHSMFAWLGRLVPALQYRVHERIVVKTKA